MSKSAAIVDADLEKCSKLSELINSKGIRSLFNISPWQYLVLVGIVISGLVAFVNLYEAITGISTDMRTCVDQTPELGTKLRNQFIVILVLSILAFVIGAVWAGYLHSTKAENKRQIFTLGLMTTGILGVAYAISQRFRFDHPLIKGISAGAIFLAFLAIGYLMSTPNWTDVFKKESK